jgi:hypothetical protein
MPGRSILPRRKRLLRAACQLFRRDSPHPVGTTTMPPDTVANITLFAKEVMPRLRELNPELRKTPAAAE